MEKDLYNILRINHTAAPGEIKEAYKKLSKKYHPDMGGTNEQMAELNYAYSVLSDPVKRKEYDKVNHTADEPKKDIIINVVSFDKVKGKTIKRVSSEKLDFDYEKFICNNYIYVYNSKVLQKEEWYKRYNEFLKMKLYKVHLLTRYSLKSKEIIVPAYKLQADFINYVHTNGELYMYYSLKDSAKPLFVTYEEWKGLKFNREISALSCYQSGKLNGRCYSEEIHSRNKWFKNLLIYIAVMFFPSAITIILKDSGVLLGGIPTFILYTPFFFLARKIIKGDSKQKDQNEQ